MHHHSRYERLAATLLTNAVTVPSPSLFLLDAVKGLLILLKASLLTHLFNTMTTALQKVLRKACELYCIGICHLGWQLPALHLHCSSGSLARQRPARGKSYGSGLLRCGSRMKQNEREHPALATQMCHLQLGSSRRMGTLEAAPCLEASPGPQAGSQSCMSGRNLAGLPAQQSSSHSQVSAAILPIQLHADHPRLGARCCAPGPQP